MIRSRASAILLVAVVTALAAGCGGDGGRLSKAEYEQKMRAIGTELTNATSTLGGLAQPGNLERLADNIADFRKRLEEAADEVDAMNPPEDAEEETEQVADALHVFADKFGRMEEAARDGDLQALQKVTQEVTQEAAEAQEATQSLKRKGYDIGELGR